MSDARERLEEYAEQEPIANRSVLKRYVLAPRAFDALRAVLDVLDDPARSSRADRWRVREAITSALEGETDSPHASVLPTHVRHKASGDVAKVLAWHSKGYTADFGAGPEYVNELDVVALAGDPDA